ncbi:uncharacterized protein LY89DRAFT_128555 [Mollisia scopiformis]|uniref:Transmembrane protein n=1 Tax=Mollisia scopiformis TaxID=149040 RepID=A0A194X4G2_MOLSC|nr:uncharacterized protein LY89DRAFT_128555 [Mollisia scopiformis]KUJ15061.1 hypothetical protein LY89DRAFT_128555 [Mollisia scopiformis]
MIWVWVGVRGVDNDDVFDSCVRLGYFYILTYIRILYICLLDVAINCFVLFAGFCTDVCGVQVLMSFRTLVIER